MQAFWPRERGETNPGPRAAIGTGGCRVEPLERRALFSGNPFELDPTFGADGFASADVAHLADLGTAVAVQADGKILVAGHTANPDDDGSHNWTGVLARFNADGSLDATFGNAGVVVTHLADGLTSLAVLGDGRILAGGHYWNGFDHGADSTLIRFNPDGSLDSAFGGGDGVVRVDLATWGEQFGRLAVAPDGKVVGLVDGANFVQGFDQGDFGVVRFNADGTVDATFGGGDGIVTTDFSDAEHSADYARAVGFTADGRIVVAGGTADHGGTNLQPRDGGFALARYNDDGSPDVTFGDGGKVITRFTDGHPNDWVTWGGGAVHDLIARPDGSLVVAGFSSQYDLTLARYAPDGSLDAAFGTGGIAGVPGVLETGGQYARLAESADGGDGSLVVAGMNSLGAYAASFAADGGPLGSATAAVPWSSGRTLTAVAFQADGRVVAGGLGAPTAMPGTVDHDVMNDWRNTNDLLVARFTAPASAVALPPLVTPPPPAAPVEPVPAREPADEPGFAADVVDWQSVPSPAAAAAVPLSATSSQVSVAAKVKSVVRSGKSATFTVTYTAGQAIDAESVRDVHVTGPNGFSAAAGARKVKANKAGTRVVATYRIAAAGGAWDVGDNGQYTAALSAPGNESARTLAGFVVGSNRLAPAGLRRALKLADAPGPSASAQADDVSAEVTQVFAWCDHMPSDGPANDRQYLTLAVTLTNAGAAARTVTLDGALLRFEGEAKATATTGISLRGNDGRAGGERAVTLQPGETRRVEFRGDRLYPEGNHDRTLNVTLVFSTPGGATFHVGGSSVVAMTS